MLLTGCNRKQCSYFEYNDPAFYAIIYEYSELVSSCILFNLALVDIVINLFSIKLVLFYILSHSVQLVGNLVGFVHTIHR